MKRLFLAIDLPEHIIDTVTATYQAIHGARWMSDTQLHVTLRFFGDTVPDQEQALIRAMRQIVFRPFTLRLKGVGHFPPRREPRILWVGIEEQPALLRLQSGIERACNNVGFPPEPRKFSPHITVARLTGGSPDRIANFLITNSLFITESFPIDTFHLYSSHLGKKGASYMKEVTFTAEHPEDERYTA